MSSDPETFDAINPDYARQNPDWRNTGPATTAPPCDGSLAIVRSYRLRYLQPNCDGELVEDVRAYDARDAAEQLRIACCGFTITILSVEPSECVALQRAEAAAECARLREALVPIAAELRHAYLQAAHGVILNQPSFARGLLGPQIEKLERLAVPPTT